MTVFLELYLYIFIIRKCKDILAGKITKLFLKTQIELYAIFLLVLKILKSANGIQKLLNCLSQTLPQVSWDIIHFSAHIVRRNSDSEKLKAISLQK